MEGDGMVAVVRGVREAGLAVTLLDGSRQYTLLPNTSTQPPATSPRVVPKTIVHVSTQQTPPKYTEPATTQCDRDAQAVDGRYASMYKTMHCNVRPTSPPIQLTEFPPQRPEVYPGHGNFMIGGSGSGVTGSSLRASSPISFRGGMCWPDRGSVCSPRASRCEDAFARSLRKYPNCLSPDRSSEVMERLVNYSQTKSPSRSYRNAQSPTRSTEPSSQNVLEPKATFKVASRHRSYETDVSIRPRKNEESPTKDRRKEDHFERPGRGGAYDVRYNMTKRMRESGRRSYTSYPYTHPVCPPTIRENQDYHPLQCDYQNSSNSVNMEIQAAVKMLSKEVATLPRADITKKTVAVPESPISSTGEDYVEGEFYYVENLDIRTSIKSIQTNFHPSDTTLKPRKSAQTVFSTIDFHSSRNRTIVSRKTKSQEIIKLTKEELKISLLELINEISDTVSKNTIRDELIKKLFDTTERNEHICDRGKIKHDKRHKHVTSCCPTVCDYVGDYQELVGKLKHCYGDTKHVMRSEIKPFRLTEYRQLDFVLKDWVNHLNLKTDNVDRYIDRNELLNSVEVRIKELLKNWTKEDFDLKSEIVDILQGIPIEINKSYSLKSYLRKLVDVLLKRMRNVIVTEQTGRVRRRPFASRSKKILTEEDMRDFVREHLLNFINKYNSRISNDTLYNIENELVDFMMDSIECIWSGHDDEIMDEIEIILQDLGKMSNKQANYVSNLMLQDLQDMLNNCVFNQTYTILNVSNNTGQYMNSTNNADSSIGPITEEDLQANLDSYTNQLCIQINNWLDGLNIPQIQDSGFREVVVNDLAGDIIDRHKYVELNHTGRDSELDQLEALKYQIFKWINKLAGDDNQETINHADELLQMINSIPVPMLVNPRPQGGAYGGVCKSACPKAGQCDTNPYLQPVQALNQPMPCCGKEICPNTPKDKGINRNDPCCPVDTCPNAGPSNPQEIFAGSNRNDPCCAMDTCPNAGPSYPQGIQGQIGWTPQTANIYRPQGPQTGLLNINRGSGRGFETISPNNPWGSNVLSSGFEPPRISNLVNSGNFSGGTCGTCAPMVVPYEQMMINQNQSMNAPSPPPRPVCPVPIKRLNEDYDEFLQQWVEKIPITNKTAAEKKAAETARLNVYNGVWKVVTKMKLDPNIFGNQHYYQDVFEEEMEHLFLGVPQSSELEAAKPALKDQLLQKTLAMNDLIKSTNAPATFKQQLMDNIDNNLPDRAPTEDDEDKAIDELDKQNMAEYYILYARYKDEDSVKANVYKKNFLKKLDEYLNKIKNRHDLIAMDTTAYANEIINSLERIPTPYPLAIKDEADEILIAMEVDNWISDIPQISTPGPLEKRRMREPIVKKIQEIGLGGCCDGTFREALKTELPRNLEKMSIQEGTNKDYLIDELANRIKNLSTSIRRVSFQEPGDYDDFGRNMPASSSMYEMSADRSSYLIVGEDRVRCSPRRVGGAVLGQGPVPEHEIQWLSMDRTEMPPQICGGYEAPRARQSPQVYNPNASIRMSQRAQSPQMFVPNAAGCSAPPERSFAGNVSRIGPNRTCGSEMGPIPQKRQRMSMQGPSNPCNRSGGPQTAGLQPYNQNDLLTGSCYPGQANIGTNAGPLNINPMRPHWMHGQTPVPEEDIQWLSLNRTEIPSQMRSSIATQRSPQVCPNATTTHRSFPGSPQVQSPFDPNTQAPFVAGCDVPMGSFTQAPTPNTQGQFHPGVLGGILCTGPPCCPNPLCNNRSHGAQGPCSQPPPHSPGHRGSLGQGTPQRFPNVQGSPSCNVPNSPLPQGVCGQGSPGRYSQTGGPAFGSVAQNTQQKICGGPNFPQRRVSQGSQGCNVQNAPLFSNSCNRSQNFGLADPACIPDASKGVSGQLFRGSPCQPPQNIIPGQDPCTANNSIRQSFGPHASLGPGKSGLGGQMSCQGPIAPQLSQVGENSCSQTMLNALGSAQHGRTSLNGAIAGSCQVSNAQPNTYQVSNGQTNNCQVSNAQPITCQDQAILNQSLQRPGPLSAARLEPDQGPGPFNLQKMAGGAIGILGTSQVPGPSVPSPCVTTGSGPNPSWYPPGQGVGTDEVPAIVITSNNQSIQQQCNTNQSRQPMGNQNPCGQQPDQDQGNRRTRNKLRTDREKKLTRQPKKNKREAVDVKQTATSDFKSKQSALSTIDITTTTCKNRDMRSKSQEELMKRTKRQEDIERTDHGSKNLEQEAKEWFEINSDKVNIKLWGEKMRKLAEKLKKPGAEEKLRTKIEKYLKQTSEQYPEEDKDILEFREQLPNNIVRKLKKMYTTPKEPSVNVYRMELPKYCSRFKVETFKKTVLNWTKSLSIKKKDFLGRNVKKDDVSKYVAEKLEPLVLDRPQSDSEYKEALQSSITEIVYELPIAVKSHNKDIYLNKAIDNLVEDILTIKTKFSSTYIQPTTKEIKEFVKDEITFFFEKCHVAVSTKRMEYLEIELVDRLLDLTDITDIDSSVADDITILLKEVSKLPEYKAKYFTNIILKDYKEFFFRENFFQQTDNLDRGRPEVFSDFQNAAVLVDFDASKSFETYRQRLVEEISKWLAKLNIPSYNKNCMDAAVTDLASDIADRYKYLLINPSATGTDAEELEQLKFQLFKWTNRLIGDENTAVLEHAQELRNEINNIPKPSLQDTSIDQSLTAINADLTDTTKSYIEKLIGQIYDWYCELPDDFHKAQDAKHINRLIKNIAEEIEQGLEKKEDGIVDKEVRKWTDKLCNKKLGYNDIQQLKSRINNVPFTKDSQSNDVKQEKVLIRIYEDIVDEWIDKIPIAPVKLRVFINNKNEIVHSLAVKIFKLKIKSNQLPPEVVEKKLQEELSHWLKKLPLHVKVDNQNDRDKYAAKLAKSIQRQSKLDVLEKHPQVSEEPVDKQLENLMLEWLKNLPLYKEKSLKERHTQEATIKELADKLSQILSDEDVDLDQEIIKHVRMLDPEQNDANVQNTVLKLKLNLRKNDLYKDMCKQRENKLLVETIEGWLKGLPLKITDVNRFLIQKTDFIKSVKQLLSSGSDDAVMRKEIFVFTRTLPISYSKIHDLKYLEAEISKLVRSLKRKSIGDVASPSSATSREAICDAIKVWSSSLPLNPVYCPRELRSFTDDICSVITSILLNPDENITKEQNDARLYKEISKFLRRFPLIYELNTESHIFGMAAELSKSLKNINLFQDDKYLVNNLTVYDVSLENKTVPNASIQSIKESDINVNLDTYAKDLVQQIGEWFDRLNLPQGNQQGFKEVVINDLAADIVDRHKYLELNPNNVRSEQEELEHLKYQIFKWINKLVGEENNETIAHAEELMQRIRKIPVPMMVKPQDKANAAVINPQPCCSQVPPPPARTPEEEAKEAMCEKFMTVFTDHCNALPLGDSREAYIAKATIRNGIMLTFFKLKADPVIENDYGYFEFILEDKIDTLLDQLPQTEELKKNRHSWKTDVLKSALLLLDEMHAVADRPSFRQNVKNNFNRQLALDNEIQFCFDLQQNFLNSVADAYILQINYKEKDPVKANIYKNRLMAEIDKLVNHLTKEHNAGFRLLNQSKLRRITMKALEQVPVPADDILQDEVEEIHLADEIEKWYKELPTKPLQSEIHGVLIKRMIDLLAKKLNEMHKHDNGDNMSMEDKMKHEVSLFLAKRGQIQDQYTHKITDMVDVLHQRLQNKWRPVQDPEGFDEFARETPHSSTLAHVDNAEFLAPLMNAATSTHPQTAGQGKNSGYFIQPGQRMQDLNQTPLCSLMTPDSKMSPQVPYGMTTNQQAACQRRVTYPGYLRQPGPTMQDLSQTPYYSLSLMSSDFDPNMSRQVPCATAIPQAAGQGRASDPGYLRQPGSIIQDLSQSVPTCSLMSSGFDPNMSRQVPCGGSQGRPNEGYASQQGILNQSIQAPASPRVNLEGSQYGRRSGITQQSPQIPKLAQVGSPRRAPLSPQTGNRAGHTSQIQDQSFNGSLRQVGIRGQVGIQERRGDQPSQMQGPCTPNMGQVSGANQSRQGQLFVPTSQRQSQGQPCSQAPVISRGPTPSLGISTTAEAVASETHTTADAAVGGVGITGTPRETQATGSRASSDEDLLDGEFRVKCRCLEAYRRMRRMDFEEQRELFRSYRYPY